MGTINRFVRGLLSTLDSQVQGQNPQTFGEEIAPVYSVKAGLQWSKGAVVSAVGASTTVVGLAASTGPQPGELWQVHAASVDIVSLDAISTTWFPALYFSTAGLDLPLATVPLGIITGVTGYRGSASVVFSEPWEISAPQSFGGYIQRFSGAAPVLGVTMLLRVLYTPQNI